MSSTPAITDPTTWALDREIVLVRVLDATRQAVFAAWTDANAFCQWFGPDGFTCTVREMDVRPGGRACFDLAAGDGTLFTNRFDYLEVVPVERLVLDHGSDTDDDPARFRVTLTLDEQSDGKTVLTLRRCGGSPSTRSSRMKISPLVALTKPPIRLSVVVLPQPDGPRRQKNSPSAISSVTPSTALTEPKRRLTLTNLTAGDMGCAIAGAAPHYGVGTALG